MVLKKTFAGAMMLVGLVVGLMFLAPYAVPMPKAEEASADPAKLAFEAVCFTCHGVDRPENYQGDKSWGEIITLMESFGAVMDDDQAKLIEEYLQKTYPREGA
jgi:mono/diheme cytochrome c family protein